jgi:outer membrane immunogenic protein
MLRRTLLASAGALALTGAALAADLPSRAPPPVYLPPPPAFTWTGVYLGGQIGYAWARDNGSINNPAPGIPGLPPSIFLRFTVNPQGVIGGAHIGYNLQFNHWVVGLEADVDGTSLSNTMLVGAFPPFFQGLLTTKTTVQGSIRARAGIAFDRVLIYATGGAVFADLTNAYNTLPLGGLDQISSTRSGWTVGGGFEYAVTNNWSVRAEYRYSDFGSRNDFSAIAYSRTLSYVITLPKVRCRPGSATSSTAWRRLRSSRNIKPLAPTSTHTKPGHAAGFYCRPGLVAPPSWHSRHSHRNNVA